MFNRLLLAGDIRTQTIKLPLHPVVLLARLGQVLATLFDFALGFTQFGIALFHAGFDTGQLALLRIDFAIELTFLQ